MISVEVTGPHLPATYIAVPNAIRSVASHVVNECAGRAGRLGGFATMDIRRLIEFVVDPFVDLDQYRRTGKILFTLPPLKCGPVDQALRMTFNSALVFLPHRERHFRGSQCPVAGQLRPHHRRHACWRSEGCCDEIARVGRGEKNFGAEGRELSVNGNEDERGWAPIYMVGHWGEKRRGDHHCREQRLIIASVAIMSAAAADLSPIL